MRKNIIMLIRFISAISFSRNRAVFINYNELFSYNSLVIEPSSLYSADIEMIEAVKRIKDLLSTDYINLEKKTVSIVRVISFKKEFKPIILNML